MKTEFPDTVDILKVRIFCSVSEYHLFFNREDKLIMENLMVTIESDSVSLPHKLYCWKQYVKYEEAFMNRLGVKDEFKKNPG